MTSVDGLAEAVAKRLGAENDPFVYVDPDTDDYDGPLSTVVAAVVAELAERGVTVAEFDRLRALARYARDYVRLGDTDVDYHNELVDAVVAYEAGES
jgi:hypothetical protein